MSNIPLRIARFSGSDADQFLQGQLTNDISTLGENWQLTAYCSPKGRALMTAYCWKVSDQIYLAMHDSLYEQTIKRLSMFVLRSDVTINEERTQIALLDKNNGQKLVGLAAEHSQDKRIILTANLTTVLDLGNYYLAIGGDTPINSTANWRDFVVDTATPIICDISSDVFVPQMLNMDVLNGISFKKGCYTGQEIIARMRYLGKLKQRMLKYSVENADNATINVGDKLDNGQIVALSSDLSQALAVVRINKHGYDHVNHAESPSIALRAIELPYKLDLETDQK